MGNFIKKMFLGNVSKIEKSKFNPIQKRIQNIQSIWNNDHEDDNGIEKIVRLFLSTSQLFFPGIYIKYLARKIGAEYHDLAMDLYVLMKVLFPIMILYNQWQNNHYVVIFMI
jgi:hypothetical protein